MQPTPITHHALDRYQDRVDGSATRQEARMAIRQILSLGRRRARPRHWMTEDKPGPGKHFFYWSERPGVCVVVVDGVAVTVVTRALARSSRDTRLTLIQGGGQTTSRRARLKPVEPWRW